MPRRPQAALACLLPLALLGCGEGGDPSDSVVIEPEVEASLEVVEASAEGPGEADPMLKQRLENFPKVRPWPIAWFEPKEAVEGADDPAPLPRREEPLLPDAAWASAAEWAEGNGTDALFVWKDGALDRSWFAAGFDPEAWVNTYYLNHFVLVMLYGTALEAGEIASLEDPVGEYIEEWAGTEEGQVLLRSLLQMHSGLELYEDNIDPQDKATRLFFGGRTTEAALEFEAEEAPDTRFEYNYLVPEILGIAIERATGQRYADLVSERIWKPIGATDGAVWLDREGGRPHFNAAMFADADDWLRFGILIAQGGQFGGEEVVPASFVQRLSEPSPTNPGYGMVWLAEPYVAERRLAEEVAYTVEASEPFVTEDLMIFDGYGGQRIYVSPGEDLVIVRIGDVVRKGWDDSELPNLVAEGLGQQ